MAELTIFYQSHPILKEKLTGTVVIGSGQDSDIRLIEKVKERHARIEVTGKGILLVEIDGSVLCNGKTVTGSVFLKEGDIFDLGTYRFHLQESSLKEKSAGRTLTTSLTETNESGIIPPLHFLKPVKKTFQRAKILVGRSPHCDLTINNLYVSSEHCEIFIHKGQYFIRDLHSKNGTFLNDFKVTEQVLSPSGLLRLGRVLVSYEIELPLPKEQVEVTGIAIPGILQGDPKRLIIGKSKGLRILMDKLKRIAPTDDSVLLLGETGVGKDLLAHFLHFNHPKRRPYPFVVVNCATIPQTIAESQLFGHLKGSFTGATTDQKGFFEQAHQGTLFLDEIGDLPIDLQAKLLRILEDGLIRPLGATKETRVNVRLVFATNKDLDAARFNNNFREDLYQRFDHIVTIPSLRDRKEDIPLLLRHFVLQHSPSPLLIDPSLDEYLQDFPWRGNIRALNRAIRVAITNCLSRESNLIQIKDFDEMEGGRIISQKHLRKKREELVKTMKREGGNLSRVAKVLGISRDTLYKWIKKDKINLEELRIE